MWAILQYPYGTKLKYRLWNKNEVGPLKYTFINERNDREKNLLVIKCRNFKVFSSFYKIFRNQKLSK